MKVVRSGGIRRWVAVWGCVGMCVGAVMPGVAYAYPAGSDGSARMSLFSGAESGGAPGEDEAGEGGGGTSTVRTYSTDVVETEEGMFPRGSTELRGTEPFTLFSSEVGDTGDVFVAGGSLTRSVPAGGVVRVFTGKPSHAILVNVTTVNPQGYGFVTVYPCNQVRPVASVANVAPGQNPTPNFVTAAADSEGNVCIYASAATDVIVDQYSATNVVVPYVPQRIVDTRGSGKKVAGEQVLRVPTGVVGGTVFANVTVTEPDADGHTTVYPCDQPRPTASTNNYVAGQTTPNHVATATSATGEVCVYSSSPTHVLWDQSADTTQVTATSPQRVLDTRKMLTRPAAGSVTVVTTPWKSADIFANVTVTNPVAPGYTTVYPCDQTRPTASTNNYVAGQTTPNLVTVTTNTAGQFCLFTQNSTHLIVDASAYATSLPVRTPFRELDTREPDDTGNWTHLTTSPAPVAWHPCTSRFAIAVNWGTTSPSTRAEVETALQRVSDQTSFPMTITSTTTVVPSTSNEHGYAARPPNTNMILAFTTPTATDIIPAPNSVAVGGYRYAGWGTEYYPVYGYVAVDETILPRLTSGQRVRLYMHEFGHALGLGHVSDTNQVMYPSLVGTTSFFGRGDVAGLRHTGKYRGGVPVC